MLEKRFEKIIKQEVTDLDGRYLRLALPGRRGWPDGTILLPGARVKFLEAKRPDGKGVIAKQQELWISRLHALGFQAIISDDIDQIREFIKS